MYLKTSEKKTKEIAEFLDSEFLPNEEVWVRRGAI